MNNNKSNLNIENIEFKSDGITLRGRLITPEENVNLPVLIMTHGSSATYNMAVIDYAFEISKSGFAVLVYDHPSIGSSDGNPRVEIELWRQARGYRDAISFVEKKSNIDSNKINVWGDSFSSWVAMLVSVVDSRVSSLIIQTTAIGDQFFEYDQGDEYLKKLKNIYYNSNLSEFERDVIGPLPMVSPFPEVQPSFLNFPQAYKWFIEFGGMPNSNWKNWITVITLKTPIKPFPSYLVKFIKCPTLVIHAMDDEVWRANPEVMGKCYKLINAPKDFVKIDGGHFGLLYPGSECFYKVLDENINFLKKYN